MTVSITPGPTGSVSFDSRRVVALAGLASIQAIVYFFITAISPRFDYDIPVDQRPILLAVGLFSACFVLHLLCVQIALQLKQARHVIAGILVMAAAFRITLIGSHPIQEVDIYRYLWDGATSTAGVSPFRYSPQQVLAADMRADLPHDLQRLVAIRDGVPSLQAVLERVHFGELTTVYPPVSQAVFAAATMLTPASSTLSQRIVVMKSVLVMFDFATIVGVLLLLRLTGRHLGWSIVYAWSPLVLKEFANSGHSDSIAVCLTAASLCCLLHGMRSVSNHGVIGWTGLASALIGIGAGAKLYPIVLFPVLVLITLRRVAWRGAVFVTLIGFASTATSLAPMVLTRPAAVADNGLPILFGPAAHAHRLSSTLLTTKAELTGTQRPESGLATYLTRWEMNDLIFMAVLENIRPEATANESPDTGARPWFAIVPDFIRTTLLMPLASATGTAFSTIAFAFARCITLVACIVISFWSARYAQRSSDPAQWLEACFLTVAWFWALSPTMNPWYWAWALPLLPFARSRAWSVVSGLLLLYYFRFWLSAHYANTAILGTGYRGEQFFHFVLVPIEHGVWLCWLAIEACCRYLPRSPALVRLSACENRRYRGASKTADSNGLQVHEIDVSQRAFDQV